MKPVTINYPETLTDGQRFAIKEHLVGKPVGFYDVNLDGTRYQGNLRDCAGVMEFTINSAVAEAIEQPKRTVKKAAKKTAKKAATKRRK